MKPATINKVLVFALDSATLDFILPLVEKGELPHLAGIINRGVHGKLRSTIPPHSAPAWITFMTGLNPGKHGVFGFTDMDLRQYNSTSGKVVNSSFYRGNTIFDYLSQKGRRVISFGLPTTYPPWEINGIMMAGWPSPDERKAFTYPADYGDKFGPLLNMRADIKLSADFDAQIEEYHYENKRLTEIATSLLREEKWDVFVFFNGILDAIQHTFWQFKLPHVPGYNQKLADKYQNVIEDMYKMLDTTVGKLLQEVGDDTYILVVSDHGSGPRPLKTFNINYWLSQEGFLSLSGTLKSGLSSAGYKGIEFLKAKLPVRDLYRKWFPEKAKGFVSKVRTNTSAVKWSQTVAYRVGLLYPYEGINLNVKERQPEGVVGNAAEYENIRSQIIVRLNKLVDPKNNQKIVEEVFKKEEIYNGPHLDNAPDIIFKLNERYEGGAGTDTLISDSTTAGFKKWSGYHLPEGIFMAAGPQIKKGVKLNPISIVDIAPTILYLSGEAIPSIMDGKVCLDILEEPLAEPKYTQREMVKTSTEGTSDEDKDKKKALRALGYLE